MFLTAYHKDDPQTPVKLYEVDARHAVANFPKEWSYSPWPEEEAKAETEPADPPKRRGRPPGSGATPAPDVEPADFE